MLNVPEAIERAYRTTIGDGDNSRWGLTADERHKEIRIHFPNGEMRDLWNYDIVQESFNFTESVCSADVLKFGLCEAAEVTFEVVGIEENFSGCKIEVFYEIDVSDIDYTENCSGRYVSDTDNCNRSIGDEVERGVYSIPIGSFTVIECTRSKSDMKHRSVRAITKVFETNDDMTPFERWRLEQTHKNKTFKMLIPQYIDCQVSTIGTDNYYTKNVYGKDMYADGRVKDACYKGKIKLDDFNEDTFLASGIIHFPGSQYSSRCSIYISLTCSYKSSKIDECFLVNGSSQALVDLYPYEYTSKFVDKEVYNMDSIYLYDCFNDQPHLKRAPIFYKPEKGFDNFMKYLYDFLYNYTYDSGSTYPLRPYAGMLKDDTMFQKENANKFFNKKVLSFGVKYGADDKTKKGSYFSILDNEYILPYDSGENIVGRAIIPNTITLFLHRDGVISDYVIPIICDYNYGVLQPLPVFYDETSTTSTRIDIYKRNTGDEGVPPEIKLKFDHTYDSKSSTSSYRYKFTDSFVMRDIMNGYLEISAMFGHQKRNGKYEYLRLGETIGTYGTFYKDSFEKLYFDEFDIDEIGYVIYNYKKNKDDKDVEVIYDLKTGGTSVYDMTDNKIFTILDEDESITDKQLRTKIEKYLNTYFKPNLGVIHYYPAEISLHSKPYLEAGDKYEIMLEPPFNTYNLSMTISGIQNSKTEIVSTSGTLIDGTSLSEDEEDDDS